ncbi:hypothetical protein ACFVBG_36040, partial [Streptomyces fimicarius]
PVPVEADRPKAELAYGPRQGYEGHQEHQGHGPQQDQAEHGHGWGHEDQAPQEQAQQHPQQQSMPLRERASLPPQPQMLEQTPRIHPTQSNPWFAAQKLPKEAREVAEPVQQEAREEPAADSPADHSSERGHSHAAAQLVGSDRPEASAPVQLSGVPPVTVTAQLSAPPAEDAATEDHQPTDHPVAGQLALEAEPEPEQEEQLPEDERVRAAVELLRSDPSMSGAAIGRRLRIPERTARRVAKQAQTFIDEQARAKYGPLRSVPTQR